MADDPRGRFSDAQREGLQGREADQDRTLAAINALEQALASPAPLRESAWRTSVREALSTLDQATAEEDANAEQPDSLLYDIRRTQPRLRSRVNGVRAQYRQLRQRIAALGHELDQEPDDLVDYADIRQRLGWLLTALRHQRARESDLIYEAYYDAFHADLRGEH
jgi:chromosome segregation ATPase